MTIGFTEKARKRQIAAWVESVYVHREVLEYLLPNGRALNTESELWDYKLTAPNWSNFKSTDDDLRNRTKHELAELVKDCIAFYNSHGGYIVFGIDDATRQPSVSCAHIDTDDFKIQLKSYAGAHIDIAFETYAIQIASGQIEIGLLCIPKRPYSMRPVQTVRGAPTDNKGKSAFPKHAILVRRDARSRPIDAVEDMEFLVQHGARELFSIDQAPVTPPLPNNLPPRDPGLVEFVGRKSHINSLAHWLVDRFDNLRMLVGLGGVGKTAIAREFAELTLYSTPPGIELLIWLTAKREFYISLQSHRTPVEQVNFSDAESCLLAIAEELGETAASSLSEGDIDEIIRNLKLALDALPALIIVDDIDSLEVNEQYELFTALQKLATLSQYDSSTPSKFLITSRLDLAASPRTTIPISGMNQRDFYNYVSVISNHLGLPQQTLVQRQILHLHEVSEGSPTFANAILRLMFLGESFDDAIAEWKGPDGEEVRRFAFERELRSLSGEGARVLYAACLLNTPTLSSIQALLQLTRPKARDAVADLRKFHLVAQTALEGDQEFASLRVAENVRLMSDLIRARAPGSKEIERRSNRFNAEVVRLSGTRRPEKVTAEIVALWRKGEAIAALELAKSALREQEDDPVILSLVARSYMNIVPPDSERAERYFSAAFDNGNRDRQVLEEWLRCRSRRMDWRGVVNLVNRIRSLIGHANAAYYEAHATAKIAENRLRERNLVDAMRKYREAAHMVKDTMQKNLGYGRVQSLITLQDTCFQNLAELSVRYFREPKQYDRIWQAVFEAHEAKVRSEEMLQLGINYLLDWAAEFANDEYSDEQADRMEYYGSQLRRVSEEVSEGMCRRTGIWTAIENLDRMHRRYISAS